MVELELEHMIPNPAGLAEVQLDKAPKPKLLPGSKKKNMNYIHVINVPCIKYGIPS